MSGAPGGAGGARREGRPAAWQPWVAFIGAAAGSTLLTVLAAIVAGTNFDEVVAPAAISLRVILVLVAPCLGALLPGLVLARAGTPGLRWAVALGAPVGPLLALRLDRMQMLGGGATLATAFLLVAWVLGTWLILELIRRERAPEAGASGGAAEGSRPDTAGVVGDGLDGAGVDAAGADGAGADGAGADAAGADGAAAGASGTVAPSGGQAHDVGVSEQE